MKILFLSHRLPYPANKGEKIRTFNQIKYLAELGHSVEVFAPIEGRSEFKYSEQFDNTFRDVSSEVFINNSRLRLAKGLLNKESLSIANFFSKEMFCAFESRLKTGDIDVVFCTSSAMVKYLKQSRVLQELGGRPKLLMDFMDLDSDKWRQYADKSTFPMSWLYSRESRLIANAEAESQKLCDQCYLIADAEIDMFNKVHGKADNVVVLGNGLNTDEFYPTAERKDLVINAPVFIFTGVMDYKPNIDAVLWFVEQCWPLIREKYTDARFIVAGMNPSTEINELAQIQGIEVTGFVDEILPYYHKADYFVAPFRIARGVQNKVLQGFACGLPVITTAMGAEGINCSAGHDVLIANSPDEFLSSIEKLQTDTTLRSTIKENALSLIRDHFSWQGKLKPLHDVLNLT